MIQRFFKIAAEIAKTRDDQRIFHVGCCGIRSDGVVVVASNGPVMLGDIGTNRTSFPAAHAEIRCSKKIDKHSVIFVARIRKDNGNFAMSRPCKSCMSVLLAKNVVRIYYTIDSNKYGSISIKNKKIISETFHCFN